MTIHALRTAVLLLAGVLPAAQLHAQENVRGVVELFTSQGCPACPPADEAMRKLISGGSVIGLSYHVDYWDYRGWADTLATPANTQRQYAYAEAMDRRGVYTPQAIVNGREHVNGSDLPLIEKTLGSHNAKDPALAVAVSASVKGDAFSIDVGAGTGEAEVLVAYFDRAEDVLVERGENAGKTISYWHNVKDVQSVARWSGAQLNLVLPTSALKEENTGAVVMVQRMDNEGNPKEIIGATIIDAQK